MQEQTPTAAEQSAFVAKLNDFVATLDPREQQWLAALVTRPNDAEAVQGYQLMAPLSLTVVPTPASGDAAAPKAGEQPIENVTFTFKEISWKY